MADRPSPDIELRVKPGGTVAFGPTQADLLEAILLTGSISAAQRQLGFGYVYAWRPSPR
jgi:molybdenum-dependent DNA-binding transcriptional regulator ModE